jgi:hypothetical protein
MSLSTLVNQVADSVPAVITRQRRRPRSLEYRGPAVNADERLS